MRRALRWPSSLPRERGGARPPTSSRASPELLGTGSTADLCNKTVTLHCCPPELALRSSHVRPRDNGKALAVARLPRCRPRLVARRRHSRMGVVLARRRCRAQGFLRQWGHVRRGPASRTRHRPRRREIGARTSRR